MFKNVKKNKKKSIGVFFIIKLEVNNLCKHFINVKFLKFCKIPGKFIAIKLFFTVF